MIIRLLVVDPQPRDLRDDIVIYQVPEKSRAHELLIEMCDERGLDHTTVAFPRRKKKGEKSGTP